MSIDILYSQIVKSTLKNKSYLIDYKIKVNILKSLPTLSNIEQDLFNKVKLNQQINESFHETRRKFYDIMKKICVNFHELGYLSQDLLIE